MLIQRATPKDKQALIKKLAEFDDYLSPLFSTDVTPFVQYKDKERTFNEVVTEWINNPDYMLFVAKDGAKLVGHICGKINKDEYHIKDTEGEIQEWFVSEVYRHKGVGKQLYDALINEFRKSQCTHITLKVFSDNRNAIDLYHKMGFIDLELTLIKKL